MKIFHVRSFDVDDKFWTVHIEERDHRLQLYLETGKHCQRKTFLKIFFYQMKT